MDYRRLGSSGLEVSKICLGGNSWGSYGKRNWSGFDSAESGKFLRHALDLGINFFNSAPSYNDGGSEEMLGAHVVGSRPRDEIVLLTKVGYPAKGPNKSGLGRKHVLASVEASLKRLATDHIDLLMVHRYDPLTPVEEIMDVLSQCVRQGKVRYLGCSAMAARQFIRLQLFARSNSLPSFIAMQNLYNLVYREDERELIPFCEEEAIGLTPYSPLARGILSGTRNSSGIGETERGKQDAKRASGFYVPHTQPIVDRLKEIADKRNLKASQVAVAWLLGKPAVAAPVVGPTKLEHIDDAVAASGIELTSQEMGSLEEPYADRAVTT